MNLDEKLPFDGVIDLYKQLKYIGPFETLTVSKLLRFIYSTKSLAADRKQMYGMSMNQLKKGIQCREGRENNTEPASVPEKLSKYFQPSESPLTIDDNIEDDFKTALLLPLHARAAVSMSIPFQWRKDYQDKFDRIFAVLSPAKERTLTCEDCWEFMYLNR